MGDKGHERAKEGKTAMNESEVLPNHTQNALKSS